MKYFSLLAKSVGIVAVALFVYSCSDAGTQTADADRPVKAGGTVTNGVDCVNSTFTVELLGGTSIYVPGTGWVWTWKITQTGQYALSHSGLTLSQCVNPEDLVSAYYATNPNDAYPLNTIWASTSTTIADDPSQDCDDAIGGIIKFDSPIAATTVDYIRIVTNKNFGTEAGIPFMVKAATCCALIPSAGPGCGTVPQGELEGCSYSQGYYFAKPGPTWWVPQISVGGHIYTEAEGRAIWNTSNKGGISDAKKCFLQVVAIRQSEAEGFTLPDATVWDDVYICEAYLSSLNQKLTPTNYKFPKTAASKAAAEAAGRIGAWIDEHHCE
jgi:hypothetical protein